uniref:Nonstructural polyprotein n=1 Tax=Guangdong fish caecilians hepevirus TaxID=2116394 RepID=A0A2P1GMS1_9VIRU|nr:nonstructural polyprotein [Guangdong fish caecilians hepevirus]
MDVSFNLEEAAAKAALANTIVACNQASLTRRVQGALVIPYAMTAKQKVLVKSTLKMDLNFTDTNNNTHAALRALHRYADHTAHLHGVAQLDLGGDPRSIKFHRKHVCMLVDNARDELRLFRAALDTRADLGTFCTGGAQCCAYQPANNHAISIHSAYDITRAEWFQIFDAHQLNTVDVWLLMPDEVTEKDTGVNGVDWGYRVDIDDKARATMLLLDGSQGYRHDWQEWKKYDCEAGWPGDDYNICISPEGAWGPLRRYTLFRAHCRFDRWRLQVGSSDSLVCVPVVGGGHVKTTRHHVEQLFAWGLCRTDDKFSFTNLAAYARALRTSLQIGNTQVNVGWSIDPRKMADVINSVYVMVAACRFTRTSTIAACMVRLKHEQTRGAIRKFVDRICHAIGCSSVTIRNYLDSDMMSMTWADVVNTVEHVDLDAAVVPAAAVAPVLHVAPPLAPSGGRPDGQQPPRPAPRNRFAQGPFVLGYHQPAPVYTSAGMHVRPALSRALNAMRGSAQPSGSQRFIVSSVPPPERQPDRLRDEFVHCVCKGGDLLCSLPDDRHHHSVRVVPAAHTCAVYQQRSALLGCAVTSLHQSLSIQATRGDAYAAPARAALAAFPDWLPRAKCSAVVGPPGCGKTNRFRGQDDGFKKNTLVVVPTKFQVHQWVKMGYRAVTVHRAVQVLDAYERIIVDEFTLVHAGLIALCMNARELIVLGDDNQITAIDYEGLGMRMQPTVLLALFDVERLSETHRCPRDVAKFLSPAYAGGVVSRSEVVDSVRFGVVCEHPNWKHLTYTQAQKLMIPGSSTVHEVQGMTFSNVCIHVTAADEPLIRTSRPHTVVAFSRHTTSCMVIQDRTCVLAEAWSHSDGVCTALLGTCLPFGPVDVPEDSALQVGFEPSPSVPEPSVGAVADDAADVFGPHVGVDVCTTNFFPPVAAKRTVTISDPGELCKLVEREVVNLTDVVAPTCRVSHPADQYAVAAANLTRVVARSNDVPAASVRPGSSALLTSFGKLLQPVHDAWFNGTVDEFCLRVAETYRSMHEKDPDLVKALPEDVDINDVIAIRNHLKQQVKYAGKPLDKIKVGQGITAWSKQANAVIAPFIRYAQDRLERNLRPNVLMLFHQSSFELSDFFRRHVTGDLPAHCNDFTEFDSTQNEITASFESRLLRRLGVPYSVANCYLQLRAHFRVVARNHSYQATWVRASGEPNTLFGNTIVTAAVNMAALNFTELECAAFKGDDAIVFARDCVFRGSEFVRDAFGMLTKMEVQPVPEFVSYFVTSEGCAPDIKRRCGKVLERNFQDAANNDAYAASVGAELEAIASMAGHQLTMLCNVLHHRMTEQQYLICYDVLKDCAMGNFARVHKYRNELKVEK